MKLRTIFSIIFVILIFVSFAWGSTISTIPNKPAASTSGKDISRGSWDNLVPQAKKEGKVNIYTNLGQRGRAAISKSMKDKYDINVDFFTAASQQMIEKILSEKRANLNLMDIVMTGPSSMLKLKTSGILASIEPQLVLPEMTDARVFPQGKVPFLDKEKEILMLLAGFVAHITINSEVIKTGELTSIQDLLKPKYKGKIVMYDPTVSGSSSNWVAYLLLDVLGLEKGKNYLKQLAAQEPVLVRNYRQLVEWVTKGKYPIGIAGSAQIVFEFQKAGAPIVYARVKEGGIMHPGETFLGMSNKPAHPNAGKLLLNWLLTAEGQTILSKAVGKPTLRIDTSNEGIDPAAIPLAGEKVFYLTEEFVSYTLEAQNIAKGIFKP